MARKYSFTLDTYDDCDYVHFCEVSEAIKELQPLTDWDDIKVGDRLHLPPIIIYGRREFVVSSKTNNFLNGMLKECGMWKEHTIFKSETSAKFLVKVINDDEDTE